MMLRMIFTALATCVLLLAAGLRFAREDAPPDVRKALSSALERAIENAKEALPRPAAQTSPEPAAETAAPVPFTAGDIAPPPATEPTSPPAEVPGRTPAREVETVIEESISPFWSAPFMESPEAELVSPGEGDPERQALHVAAAPSQDEWAGLIRRLLAIYERVGTAE
jgi:hypothetical protein